VRPGPRLGVDVGTVRVGLARSDAEGLLAVPVETFPRDRALEGIVASVEEVSPLEVIVGLPLGLSGRDTLSTSDAREFAEQLAASLSVPVRLVDERLSTVQAQAGFQAAGRSRKNQRQVIDQAAAVILLQHALDSERAQGVAPGHRVDVSGMSND